MNKDAAITRLADFIVGMTDPKLTRWRKEQLEHEARAVAKRYLKVMGDNNE